MKSSGFGFYGHYLIEGIGSNDEFIPQSYFPREFISGLLCHSINGKVLYIDSLRSPNGCSIISASSEGLIGYGLEIVENVEL